MKIFDTQYLENSTSIFTSRETLLYVCSKRVVELLFYDWTSWIDKQEDGLISKYI